jgi:hypothetical protein
MESKDDEIIGAVPIPGSRLGWRIFVTRRQATQSPNRGLFRFFIMIAPFAILAVVLVVAANQ